jgi:hypothetical protein
VRILLVAHAKGRYAQTEEARIETTQLLLYGRQIEKINMDNFAQFRMGHSPRPSVDDQNLFDIGMVQTLQEDTFSDHARCSGYDCSNVHGVYGCGPKRDKLFDPKFYIQAPKYDCCIFGLRGKATSSTSST